MARQVSRRLRLRGFLKARTPFHVGGAVPGVESDLPLARDGNGNYHIPGTSLAGAMRARCVAALKDDSLDDLWGFQNSSRSGKQGTGMASRIFVEDGAVQLPAGGSVEIRDHVGLDEMWGVASEHIKFDQATLPRGTRIALEVCIELSGKERDGLASYMLACLIEDLEKGRIRIGAARSRGLGRVELENWKVQEEDLSSPEGILGILEERSRELQLKDLKEGSDRARWRAPAVAEITLHWKPLGPVMVKAPLDAVAVDTLPLLSTSAEGKLSPVLPGSSVKGALRAHAARILRTVIPVPDISWPDDGGQRFLKQKAELSLVSALFGAAPASDESRIDDKTESLQPLPGLAALAVDDCYARTEVTHDDWNLLQALPGASGNDEAVAAANLGVQLKAAGLDTWTAAHHVAIDRWTGGSADSLLYSVLEPHGTEWEPLVLRIDLDRLSTAHSRAALALLFLTLRDLGQGKIPLGFAVNRGMGSIAIERFQIEGDGLDETPLSDLSQHGGDSLDLELLPDTTRGCLREGWSQWLAAVRTGEETP